VAVPPNSSDILRTKTERTPKKEKYATKYQKGVLPGSSQLFLSAHDFCISLLDRYDSFFPSVYRDLDPVTFTVFKIALSHQKSQQLAPDDYPSLPSTSKHIATVPGVHKHLP